MNHDIILKASDVCFSYEDGTEALKGINLEIKRGQKIAFMGANGSGKSTFFLCLNGIHHPQKGTMYYNGEQYDYSRKGLLKLRSKVGIVFQDPDNQLFSASVYQEISFGILNLGVSEETAKEEVGKVIDYLEITPFCNKPTHALSGGQKKQVSVADILVMNPDVIILDEPAAALDPKHTSLVNGIVEQLTDRGITVIVSTHDVNYALEWADEVILFHQGKVLMQGTPEEVFVNQSVLAKTNLEKPAVLKFYDSLCKKGILTPKTPLPKNFSMLENDLEEINMTKKYPSVPSLTQDGKTGILVVSFGTTHHDTCEKNIHQIEKDIMNAYPECSVYRAWTSKMIIRRLKDRDNIIVHQVKEAVEQMKADGITDIIVQPTHVINGIENNQMIEDVMTYSSQFNSIRFGTPLLTSTRDNEEVIQALMKEFIPQKKDEVLVFMGHGTTHYANSIYAAIDYTFKDMGYENVFLGTVEAYPSMESLLRLVREYGPKRIILAPFMIVAGEHAKNDMAGEDSDSWKNQFEQAGFEVSYTLKGLGEYKGIREIFLRHIEEAR